MWTNHQNSWRICAEHLRSEAAQFLSRVYAKLFVGRRWVLSALFFDFLASQRGHLLRLCTSHSHKQSRVPFAFLNISFLQAPLRRCGLIVSSPVQCFLPGWRFAEALFVVSRLDSTAAKEYNSKHFHYPISNFVLFFKRTHVNLIDLVKSIYLQISSSIQPRTSPLKVCRDWKQLDR